MKLLLRRTLVQLNVIQQSAQVAKSVSLKFRLKIFPLLLTSQQKVQECDATADAIKINSRAQKMLFFNVDNLNDK